MVLYGDSITENWRGTSTGELWKWSNGTLDSRFVAWNMKAVFQKAFQEDYRTGVMAIAGANPPGLAKSEPTKPESAAVLPTGLFSVMVCKCFQTEALAGGLQPLSACNSSMPHMHVPANHACSRF